MPNFYFTYGSENHPYYGGWTQVVAPHDRAACHAFRAFHPDRADGLLDCCRYYTEEQFLETSMAGENGNLGRYCHELIIIQRTLISEEANRYAK